MSANGQHLGFRQRVILQLMAEGFTDQRIGSMLGLQKKTISKLAAREIYRKLGARHRAHAVAIALRAGLIR